MFAKENPDRRKKQQKKWEQPLLGTLFAVCSYVDLSFQVLNCKGETNWELCCWN